MDIIISVSSNHQIPFEFINLIAHAAKIAGMRELKIPVNSRIPLIRVIDSFTGLKCDLRLDASSSIHLYQLFKRYRMLDSRFEELCYISKYIRYL